MSQSHEAFTSLTAVPEVSKADQTELWTLFYLGVINRASLDDASMASLREVVSANVGEPVDPAIVAQTVRTWIEQAGRG